jgi:hypothetical protein
LFIGMMLFAATGVPTAGAQGLSGADTTVLNNLLGAGVLGAEFRWARLPARRRCYP